MRILLWLTVVCAIGLSARGQDIAPLRKVLDESLAAIELWPEPAGTTPMTARVAMRWANNARGSETGMTVLYLADGVPQAVCCVYPWEKLLIHEFDSLSRGRLIGKLNGVVFWNPAEAGLTFRPVPGAEAPAESPAARLRQMKTLAAEFSSTMLGWKSDRSDREELRLLPQPLSRYEKPTAAAVDGAVFAFVQGTDPESLLLIEAVREGATTRWEYAFARRTSGELEGRHKEAIVWHADRYPWESNPRHSHFSLREPLDATVVESLRAKEQ